ncbi:hypothetical protein [Bdellovibrio sp. GT3]|uniref:hypothetical protein n=1 Tax=unclassified Bdellovibrio TaxID=2633795 RepID=UPI0030EFE723
MAHKNKKNKSAKKPAPKPSKENSRKQQRGWDQETSADVPYDDSIESPRSHNTPSMY